MANIASVKNAIATTESTSLQELISQSAKELGRALPEHLKPERLVRIALTCIRMTPDLGKCTPESFLGALFTAAQLGVEPVAGRAYILPFNNSRKIGNEWKTIKEAQFMMGYKGLVDLFYRHEKSVELAWDVVHANDEFDYEKGTNAFLKHKPAKKDRGPMTDFWVVATLQGGGKPFEVMSLEDCLEHGKKHSKTYDAKTGKFYDKSPWTTSLEAMCLKTVLIQLAKLLPLSIEIQRAIQADETSRDFRKGISDVLEMPETTNWEAPKDAVPENDAIEPEGVDISEVLGKQAK